MRTAVAANQLTDSTTAAICYLQLRTCSQRRIMADEPKISILLLTVAVVRSTLTQGTLLHHHHHHHIRLSNVVRTQLNTWMKLQQESRADARKPRDAAAVPVGLKFADDIHHKFKSSQASKARLQSSKHTGTKQNLTQIGDSRSFKVTCFGVSGKATRH